MDRNPTLAVFSLVVGCFVIAVGLSVARSTSTVSSQTVLDPTLLAPGTQMPVMAAPNALPGRMRRSKTTLRVLGILLALVAVPLATIGVIVAGFR